MLTVWANQTGLPGHIVDILAALATLFGLATSLGLGVQQINAGLNHVFGVLLFMCASLVLGFRQETRHPPDGGPHP